MHREIIFFFLPFFPLSLSLSHLFMSLVKFDLVNCVFILEVLTSLRDSFHESRASWSSSSLWIFCSSHSLALVFLPPLAPKTVGKHPVLSPALLSLHRDLILYTLPQRSYLLLCHLDAYGAHIRSSSPDFIPGLQNCVSNCFLDVLTHILYNCFKFSPSKIKLVLFPASQTCSSYIVFSW